MKTKVIVAALIFALLWIMTPIQAEADLAAGGPGPRPNALFTNNSADWSTLGSDGAVISNGTTTTADAYGTIVTVSTSTGTDMVRKTQYNPSSLTGSWDGNFAPGDALLWTNNVNEAQIIFDFSTDIFGGIAQLQSEQLGEFTGSLMAFDEFGNPTGITISAQGESTQLEDNSALYLFTLEDDANVHRLVFSVTDFSGSPIDFAINRLDFLQCPPVGAEIPVPPSIFLLGSGLLGLGLWGRRSRKRG